MISGYHRLYRALVRIHYMRVSELMKARMEEDWRYEDKFITGILSGRAPRQV